MKTHNERSHIMVCLNHPDREAVYKCAACGKPLCEECAVIDDVDVYCSDECMQKGIAAKSRSSYIIEDTARNNRKRGIKSFAAFVIILMSLIISIRRIRKKLTVRCLINSML